MKSLTYQSVRFLKENLILPFLIIFSVGTMKVQAQCLITDCEEVKSKTPVIFNAEEFKKRTDVPKLDIKIHPNPNPRKFTLKFEVPTECDLVIRITNKKGVEVYREELKQFKGYYLEVIDLNHLTEGDYYIYVDYLNRTQQKRMVTYIE